MYVKVPNAWNDYKLNGNNLPGQGYATYRLHVKTDIPKDRVLAFRTYFLSSAFKLFVNGEEIASNGKVSTGAKDSIPQYRPKTAVFCVPGEEFDIIVQVSNFHHARGGFWYKLNMGRFESILEIQQGNRGKENFFLGISTVFAFYLFVYFLNRKLRYTLYFSLTACTLFVAVDMSSELLVFRLFPNVPYNFVIFLTYISTTWFILSFILCLSELYPSKIAKILLKIFFGIAVSVQLIYTVTKPVFYTGFGLTSNAFDMIGVVFAIIIASVGIKNGKKDGWLNIFSIVALMSSYIYDVSYWRYQVEMQRERIEILFIGVFIFLIIQMIIQAGRISSYRKRQVAVEMAFLQSQIKPHFIFNALNTIISISRYDTEKSRNLLMDFSCYLRRSFDIKNLSQFTSLKNEIELLSAFIEIEKVRFEERLEIVFIIPEEDDFKVPILMLQPIVENAIKHGILPKPTGGKVVISIEVKDNMLEFNVKDNGVGMDKETISEILKPKDNKGIAIVNINSRLIEFYGRGLVIKSSPNEGTEVSWRIPTSFKEQ